MAVDTPAKIAILGAGPIGLEAALYARFLGYEVEVFDSKRDVAGAVLERGHLELLSPFHVNSSPLGLRAITAHDNKYQTPGPDEYLTNAQWHEAYLSKLAATDLIAESLRLNTVLHGIGKVELIPIDRPQGEFDRGAWDFRLLVYDTTARQYRVVTADIVLDCRCVGDYCIIGHGEMPAIGELGMEGEAFIDFHPDILGKDIASYADKSVLVVGATLGAARSVCSLLSLKASYPYTQIAWSTRHPREACPQGPLPAQEGDPLERRRQLFDCANSAAIDGPIQWLPEAWIESLVATLDNRVQVQFTGASDFDMVFDRLIGHTSPIVWNSHATHLQLDICPITDAPRPFSEYLLKRPSPYSVEYPAPNPQALITSEPNYYVLGSKSFGRMPGFLYQHGLRQIRDVFTIIGDRTDLDLYAQMK